MLIHIFFLLFKSTVALPYLQGICPETPSGRLKPQRVPDPIPPVFPSTYTPTTKFNLPTRHSKRLATTTDNKTEQLQRYTVIRAM